jgi:hypothetical protein
MRPLTIRLPDAMHARLLELADERGVRIGKLIADMTVAAVSAHDAEVRFRRMAARGNPKRMLALLDRLDAEEARMRRSRTMTKKTRTRP